MVVHMLCVYCSMLTVDCWFDCLIILWFQLLSYKVVKTSRRISNSASNAEEKMNYVTNYIIKLNWHIWIPLSYGSSYIICMLFHAASWLLIWLSAYSLVPVYAMFHTCNTRHSFLKMPLTYVVMSALASVLSLFFSALSWSPSRNTQNDSIEQ